MRNGTRTSHYEYALPPELIAQSPAARRDESRLMVVTRATGEIEHRIFREIIGFVPAGDAIVRNTSRVYRARLLGTRNSGAPAEVLLLRQLDGDVYEAMVHPGGKLRPGRRIRIADDLHVEILGITERRTRTVRLDSQLPVEQAIDRYGHVPLPPYIHRTDEAADSERYQTVYARERGSVAAPTAGLHFTTELLDALGKKGVRLADVVLHVGAGTFKPVETDDPAAHVMHSEYYSMSGGAARTLNETRRSGGSIWAVGTTAVRTLESASAPTGQFIPVSGETDIFIRPPYSFRAVDHLLTNFHLPRSTLLMLVAAFAGYDLTMHAYDIAVRERYRFYSYGDAMLII